MYAVRYGEYGSISVLPEGVEPYGRTGDELVCVDQGGLFYRHSADGRLHPLHGERVRSFARPDDEKDVYWPANADSPFDSPETGSWPIRIFQFDTDTADVTPVLRADDRGVMVGMRHAVNVFEFVSLCVPRAVSVEQVGDAIECIARLTLRGAPTWKIVLKTWSTVFWIGVNAVRHVVRPRSESKLPKVD